jgi:pilus assembly protein CpaF
VTMIRTQMATAIDVIVFLARLRDGTRKILNIARVDGVENDAITWQNVFYYQGVGL